jgi:hypothetical protein
MANSAAHTHGGRVLWSVSLHLTPDPWNLTAASTSAYFSCQDVLASGESCTSVADPFLIRVHDTSRRVCTQHPANSADALKDEEAVHCTADSATWYMFVEVVGGDRRQPRGRIGVASSRDGLQWQYLSTALELAEDQHLSFPFVFTAQSASLHPHTSQHPRSAADTDFYLLPQYSGAGLPLWFTLAHDFPFGWRLRVPSLVAERECENDVGSFRDSIMLFLHNQWWLITMPLHDCPPTLPSASASRCLVAYASNQMLGPYLRSPDRPLLCTEPSASSRVAPSLSAHQSATTGRLDTRLAGLVALLPPPSSSRAHTGMRTPTAYAFVQLATPFYGAGVDAYALNLPALLSIATPPSLSTSFRPVLRAAALQNVCGAHTFNVYQYSSTIQPALRQMFLIATDSCVRQH